MPRQMLTLEGETRLAAWHVLGVSVGAQVAEAELAASVFDFTLQSTRQRSLDALRERHSPVSFAARVTSGDTYQIVRGRRVSLTDEARNVIFSAIERLSQPPRGPLTQSIPDMGEERHPPQEPPVAGDIMPDLMAENPLPDMVAATTNVTRLEEMRARLQEVADATAPRQLSLLPEEPVPYELRTVPLDQLRYRASEPSGELMHSIEAFGVFQPIVVIDRGELLPRYQVVAGRRRVTAMYALRRTEIPALVFPVGTSRAVAASVALMENGLRAENPLTDMMAIESLMVDGATLEQISTELGLGRSVIRARLQLRQLVPALRELLERGAITLAMATEIARYSIAVQHAILDHWNTTHMLTIADVRRFAGRGTATVQEPLPLEPTPPSLRPGSVLTARHATAVTVTPELVEITVSNGVVFRVGELRIVDMGAPHRALAAAEEGVGASYARQQVTFTAPRAADVAALQTRARPTRQPPAPSDDRELSEAEVAALQAEMERTPAAPGEESWSRVGHLLNLALACVPVAPDGQVEDLYAAISAVVTHVAALSAEETNVDTTLALPVVGAARPRAQRALRTRR